MYSAAIMKNQPSHHARFAPETIAGAVAGNTTCLMYFHPLRPKLFAESATFAGMPRTAPNTPKNIAQAIDVKSNTTTASSMPNGSANRKPMTMGKYPRIGIDCNRSMKGVMTSEATLFVAHSMPKETPQAIEIRSVTVILKTVLKVYIGRYLTSSTFTKVMISQVITQRIINPMKKLSKYFRKSYSPLKVNRGYESSWRGDLRISDARKAEITFLHTSKRLILHSVS
jgi:hypothetical protein